MILRPSLLKVKTGNIQRRRFIFSFHDGTDSVRSAQHIHFARFSAHRSGQTIRSIRLGAQSSRSRGSSHRHLRRNEFAIFHTIRETISWGSVGGWCCRGNDKQCSGAWGILLSIFVCVFVVLHVGMLEWQWFDYSAPGLQRSTLVEKDHSSSSETMERKGIGYGVCRRPDLSS
jgi:hypothetical protein